MTTDFDSWVAQIDPEELQRQIVDLQNEIEERRVQIEKRSQALRLIKLSRRTGRAREDHAAGTTSAEQPEGGETRTEPPDSTGFEEDGRADVAGEDVGTSAEASQVARIIAGMEEKEQILIELLREAPDRRMHVRDVRKALDDHRIQFDGTPERGVLWRLAQRGAIGKVRQGVYELPADEPE
jgi:hypothetical protein